jgi:hypothetical protein
VTLYFVPLKSLILRRKTIIWKRHSSIILAAFMNITKCLIYLGFPLDLLPRLRLLSRKSLRPMGTTVILEKHHSPKGGLAGSGRPFELKITSATLIISRTRIGQKILLLMIPNGKRYVDWNLINLCKTMAFANYLNLLTADGANLDKIPNQSAVQGDV